MKLNKFKQLIREEIQNTLDEISPETFKSAIDKSTERTKQQNDQNPELIGIDKRAQRLAGLYFKDFIGKPFANGKITKVGIIEGRILGVTYELPETTPGYREGMMKEHHLFYYINGDNWVGVGPISRADARLLGKMAAHLNPNTKYKNYTEFTISGDVSEAFLGMGDSDVVKKLLKMASTDGLPKSTFNQFGSISFTLPITPAENALYTIQLMDSKPTFEMKILKNGGVSEKVKATNSSLKTLYTKFFSKTTPNSGVDQKYNEVKYILGLNEGLGKMAKNAALGALTAASLMGSPKANAAGGHKDKIEYSQNIPAERQKEVIKAFIEFLSANDAGANENPTNVEILIEKDEFDQVVNLFMVSEENEDTGTTQAESEILRKNFNKIYKKFLVNNNR